MTGQRCFRILTPDGLLTRDTFVLPPTQPLHLPDGCVVLVHERSGLPLTVRDTRLFSATQSSLRPFAAGR